MLSLRGRSRGVCLLETRVGLEEWPVPQLRSEPRRPRRDVMTTSSNPIPPTRPLPLRLRIAAHTGRGQVDGGWWPQSRDLAVELADLVDHFPREAGRIERAVISLPDWDPSPRRVPVARGFVKVGTFPKNDNSHVILLKTPDNRVLRILVVPPGLTASEGEEALLASSISGNAHSAYDLL